MFQRFNRSLAFVAILIFAVIIGTGFKGCSKSGSGKINLKANDGVFRGVLFEKHKKTTARGIRVMSGDAIDSAALPRIDSGIDKLFRIAAREPNNYDISDMAHSNFYVYLYRRSDRCINPAFLVEATGTPYADTEYDKDPRPGFAAVCAAGMNINEELGGMILVNDLDTLEIVSRYEGEHLLLYKKDRKRWEETMYDGTGAGHPILGEEQPAAPDNFTAKIRHDNEVPTPNLIVEHFELDGVRHCVLLTK